MKKIIFSLVVVLFGLFVFAIPARADSVSVNFESPFTIGSVNGQFGWSMTGPYDVAVDNNFGYSTFGSQSFRISNAITSGSFGDWAFSKSLSDEAGETAAQNGGLSGGTRQPYFEVSFDFASTVPNAEQPGLQMSLAPDRGDGARMSFLRLKDTSSGLQIDFDDYQSGLHETGCTTGVNFVDTTIASALDRTVPHHIKLTMQFIDGLNNDIVKVYVDGSLVHTGTSWEGYFNECEGNPTRTVDSLIFQARSGGGTAPSTNGNGFLIDNLTLVSGPVPVNSQQTSLYKVSGGSSDNVLSDQPYDGHITLITPDGVNSFMLQGVIQGLTPNTQYEVWVRNLTGYSGPNDYEYSPLGYYALTKFTTNKKGAGNFNYKIERSDLPAGKYFIQVAINTLPIIGNTVAATTRDFLTVYVGD